MKAIEHRHHPEGYYLHPENPQEQAEIETHFPHLAQERIPELQREIDLIKTDILSSFMTTEEITKLAQYNLKRKESE